MALFRRRSLLRQVLVATIMLMGLTMLLSGNFGHVRLPRMPFSAVDQRISEVVQNITEGVYFGIDPNDYPWRSEPDPLDHGAPSPDRCPIYTYVDRKSDYKDNGAVIEVWKRAWWAAGFDPRVLTRKDCEKHPEYDGYEDDGAMTASYKKRHRKWFAWAANGAGVYAHYQVLPMNWQDTETAELLRSCSFDDPILFEGMNENLAIAGPTNLDAVVRQARHSMGSSDKVLDQFDRIPQDFAIFYDKKPLKYMIGDKDANVQQVAEIMDAHLHQAFLARYPKGIAIVNPLRGMGISSDVADALDAPAKMFSQRILTCPSTEYADTCPPSKENVLAAKLLLDKSVPIVGSSYAVCGNPCSKGAPEIPVTPLKSLPPRESGYFSLVSVPHPFVALAALNANAYVGATEARAHQLRDEWLRILTYSYLPQSSSVGSGLRLMLARDSAFQVPTLSDSVWFPWDAEWGFVNDVPESDEKIEWDLGFGLAKTNPAKNFTSSVLNASNARVTINDGKKDNNVSAVENWNSYHHDLWSFVKAVHDVKNDELNTVLDSGVFD